MGWIRGVVNLIWGSGSRISRGAARSLCVGQWSESSFEGLRRAQRAAAWALRDRGALIVEKSSRH